MNGEVQIDAMDVLDCAAALTGLGDRVAEGASGVPDPPPSTSWTVGAALTATGDAARAQLHAIGAEIASTARQITAAVADYEDADARAASRLRGAR
jgi:hypothetical protein